MRNLILLFCLFIIGLLSAQSSGHQTLLGRSPLNGAFGAPIYEFSVGNDVSGAVGGGGGLVFRNFFLGAYGMASNDALQELLDDGEITGIDLTHGGLWIGATPGSYNVVHPYVGVRGGWGVIDVLFDDPNQNFNDLDQVFVVTPEAGFEFNVTRWFRVAATANYRLVTNVNDTTPNSVSDKLQGFTGGITLRFGWFGSNRWSSRRDW